MPYLFFMSLDGRTTGVRQEQDLYIRLIDSVAKTVSASGEFHISHKLFTCRWAWPLSVAKRELLKRPTREHVEMLSSSWLMRPSSPRPICQPI